jgi:NADPH:quinone reductase-like Zn-dependent oxidoreductase
MTPTRSFGVILGLPTNHQLPTTHYQLFPMTTRCWQLTPDGTAYRLVLTSRPLPSPGAGEVVVRVRAVSLNYRDLINLRNTAGRNVAGRIPASDGAGEIVAVGPGVTAWQPGDRVAACFFPTWTDGPFELRHHQHDLGGTIDGMLAETVLLSTDGLVRIPDHLSYEEAATLPCAAVTAWQALVARGGLHAGQTVLALGTGGVSTFALQIATAVGARVIITSSSETKLAKARQLGAWQTLNYRTMPDWEKEVWRLTDKRGVDHVMEVGGPETLAKSMQCVAGGGHIALIGVLTGFGAPTASLFPLVARNVQLNGIYVGSRAHFEAMNRFLAEKQIRPVIDRVFSFEDAAQAYEYLASGSHLGKVVIAVG